MRNIQWTLQAQDSYLTTLDFIYDQWGLDASLQWDAKVQNTISNISSHNKLCPPSKKFPELRKCTITKYTALLYRVMGKQVQLISFLDARQDHPF